MRKHATREYKATSADEMSKFLNFQFQFSTPQVVEISAWSRFDPKVVKSQVERIRARQRDFEERCWEPRTGGHFSSGVLCLRFPMI